MFLTVVMITRNCGGILGGALESIDGLWDELLVSDQNSSDGTRKILEQYKATISTSQSTNLGKRKQGLLKRARGDWILVLDSDERVSPKLYEEIQKIHGSRTKVRDDKVIGYKISYQNYVFGKPVYWGGERYSKVRLFKRGYGSIDPVPLHEEVVVRGKIGNIEGMIYHHSFRTPVQLFNKFTGYALTAAKLKKTSHERISISKLFLYGPHMFWARCIKEKGYKDGVHGFILAFAFAYMECLTYWILLFL